MARPYPRGFLSAVAVPGLEPALPRVHAWPGSALRRLRGIVLPDPESEEAPPERDASESSRARRVARVLTRRLFTALLLTLLVLVIGLVTFRLVYADRVYPAVVVGDVPVGGLTVSEAEARLQERATVLDEGTVTFILDGQRWTPTLSELGVTFDLETSMAAAHQLGRDDNPTARLSFVSEILNADQVVPLRSEVNLSALHAWYDTVDRDIDKLPVDASIAIEGTDVTIVPGRSGIVVDRPAATALILDALSSLEPVDVELPTRVADPEISAEALEPVRAHVIDTIGKPVMATLDGKEWDIAPETIIPFIDAEIVVESGNPAARLTIDTVGLARELRTQYSHEVARKPVDAVLGWDNGVVAVEPSVTGTALKSDAFAEVVSESFLTDHQPVEIPVVWIKPTIDSENLAAYGITELLGEGHSNFEGGTWARDENIRIATRLMNGTLVAPGENFSFNRAIGEITADKGYQEALVVVADQVGRDVGGGVCQVSTTVFRAAINGGMPIVEWHPHSYRLPNYERDGWGPGFDASILQIGPNPDEWPDFRFENYTDHWLLIESYVSEDESRVYVNIYGTSDGRSVSIDAWPIGGNTFGFTRVIHDREGTVIAERTFESHFL